VSDLKQVIELELECHLVVGIVDPEVLAAVNCGQDPVRTAFQSTIWRERERKRERLFAAEEIEVRVVDMTGQDVPE
jgi:hypothetical protein